MEGGRYLGKGLMMIRDLQVALEGGRGVERRKRKRKEKKEKKEKERERKEKKEGKKIGKKKGELSNFKKN
jgi:hypothetical protein